MNIQVRPAQEDAGYFPFNVTMSKNSTLVQLKTEVKQRWNLHPKQQRFSYNFEDLEGDAKTLTALQITNNATVFVGFVAATIRIFLRPIDPRHQPKRMNANLNWTVNELKREAAKIMRELGHGQVKLCLQETELEGDMPLRSVKGLDDECELLFKVREVGGKLVINY